MIKLLFTKLYLMLHYFEAITVKLWDSLILSLVFTPLIMLLSFIWEGFNTFVFKYLILDKSFTFILTIAILADLVTGMIKHWKLKTFDFKALFTGLVEKIAISYLAMILFNGFVGIDEVKQSETVTYMVNLIGKLLNFVYVAGSAFANMHVITNGKFPPTAFMSRLKRFNETLDPNTLTQKDNG